MNDAPTGGEPATTTTARNDWLLIPNQLTLSRFIAAALVPAMFLILERPNADLAALALFVYASLTDFVDGWAARRFNQMSALGAKLDPLADKALLLATLIPLCVISFSGELLFLVGAGVITMREIGVSLLRRWRPNASALKVRRDAKWKTAAQMGSVSLLLTAEALIGHEEHALGEPVQILGLALFAAAVVLSATTGLAYLRGALAAPDPKA